jgi:hypothetical protein
VIPGRRGHATQTVAYRLGDTKREHPLRIDAVADGAPISESSQWYYGYVENCFDPYRVLVRGEGLWDAYEWLICNPHIESACEITDVEEGDYPEDFGTWNDNGKRLDTEAVHLFEVEVRVVQTSQLPAGF